MRAKVASILLALLAWPAWAQPQGIVVGQTPVVGGSAAQCLTIGSAGLVSSGSCGGGSSDIVVNTTVVTGGTNGNVLTIGSGKVQSGATTGSGNVVLATGATLTLLNATGLPISTGVSGLGTGVATFLGAPSSANLAAALTDETGTGLAVFATSPTLTGQPAVQDATTASPGWYAQVTGDSVPRIRLGLNSTDVASIAMGSGSATRDTFIERAGAANVRYGAPDAAAPVAQTISTQNVVTGTSNTAGANLTVQGSQGTGTGAGGSIIFQTATAGSTGSTPNALVTVLTINSSLQTIASGSTAAALPALSFATDPTSGIYQRTTSTLDFSTGGTLRLEAAASVWRWKSDSAVGFSSGAASTGADIAISRIGAGVLGVGTGAQGSLAGQLYAATVRTGQTTVAGLPAAATAGAGARAYVTDASVCTFLSTVVAGGSTKCPVTSDGTNWIGG